MTDGSNIIRKAALGLFVAFASANLPTVSITSAQAQERSEFDNSQPDFGDLQYVPGRHWYRIAATKSEMSLRGIDEGVPPIPGLVVGAIQRATGRQFCKYMINGSIFTNLKFCAPDSTLMVERGDDPRRGLVLPPQGGLTNLLYTMAPSFEDLPLAKRINAEVATFRWPAQEPVAAPIEIARSQLGIRTATRNGVTYRFHVR
ncbi:MAG: hypothetical protein KGQ41_02600 [Alphaproteobacteria bacterium]|nr:hypothetical protein [Alphaproteobacteria bacterium]